MRLLMIAIGACSGGSGYAYGRKLLCTDRYSGETVIYANHLPAMRRLTGDGATFPIDEGEQRRSVGLARSGG